MVCLDKISISHKRDEIVIIGNGVAGNSTADTVRAINPFAEVTIISKNKDLFYSACALPNYLAGEIKRKYIFIKDKYDYKREKINLILGEEVENINHKLKKIYTKNGICLTYDKLIIASGSYPYLPNNKYINLPGIYTFKNIQDTDKLINNKMPKKIIVVGGGAVGIELSISLIKKENVVYLIELAPQLMLNAFDIIFSDYIKKIIQNHGIKVFTSTRLISIEGEKKVKKVITDQNDIYCDLVIFVIGMKPDVEFAKKSGIKIGKFGGIKVNNKMLTNIKDIYACGDCVEIENENNMLWLPAKSQGKIAAFNCCGLKQEYQNNVNVLTLNIGENYFISFGKIINVKSDDFLEKKQGKYWWKLIFFENKAVGAQIVNNIEIAQLLYILINKRVTKEECQAILNKPFIRSPIIFSKEFILQKMRKII